MKFLAVALLGLALQGCKTITLDPSISAAEANDLTLIASSCEALPSRGADICRVKEGTPVSSGWRIIIPVHENLLGGELTVYYKDFSRSYAIGGPIIEVPWIDLVRDPLWKASHDDVALALAQVRYKDEQGIEKIVRARGIAILSVLAQGYDPMPIDSGFAAFGTTCKIQYSTAGRSALKCSE